MNDSEEFPIETGGLTASRFHILQANRDLQSNWELDLAKNLEEYLLKVCSGEITDENECSVNFAEAALLLQGSVQVYSRKVEYLHSLVLAALEFLSQKRQDQQETTSEQPDGSTSATIVDKNDDEVFLDLDDVPVDPKNCFDREHDKEDPNIFLKPPANLLVLEGDCLDSGGDAGELESFLLSTCNFYKDFLLLDPCDAGAVFSFMQSICIDKEQPSLQKGSSFRSKNKDNIFTSPTRRSTPRRSSVRKKHGTPLDDIPESNHTLDIQDIDNTRSAPHLEHDYNDDLHDEQQFGVPNVCGETDSEEDEDPWKPLNPHEPGNLKIKPYRASKSFGRKSTCNTKTNPVTSQFPIAKLEGIISSELAESFDIQMRLQEKKNATQSPSFFEKLRRSFANVEECVFSCFDHENDDNGVDDFPDFDHVEFDPQNSTYDMDIGLSPNHVKDGDAANFDGVGGFSQDDPSSQASLEDLCRSHLDALLASIAETEKQTELATRVSTWKQRIEQTLEEQDSHPPFDIHRYGDVVLDRLSLEADTGANMTFTDVVKGQPKHDVARTFSALLQLVNNGDVELQKAPSSSGLICYTSKNPFRVKLLRLNKKRVGLKLHSARKKAKHSPSNRNTNTNQHNSDVTPNSNGKSSNLNGKSLNLNGKSSIKFGKGTIIRCTPESKRRRISQLAETVDVIHGSKLNL